MSPALLGSSTAGTAPGGPSPRTETRSGGARRDFDALLDNGAGAHGKDAPKRTEATKPTRPATAAADEDRAAPPATPTAAAEAETAETAAATDTAAPDAPAAQDEADDSDTAPWPPLGLAGLVLAGLDPAAPATQATAPGALAGTNAALPGNPAAAPTSANATATVLAADPAAAAPAPAATAAQALPELPAAEDVALPKAIADALAATSADGGDAPAAPLLHALHSVAEARPSSAAPLIGPAAATPTLGADDFDDAIGARVSWLADQKIGHAHIKISPDDLGAIDVRLQLDGDKVHASFTSTNAEVRHALESSLPRLREMLGEQGFQLGQADVGQQQTAQGGNAGSGQGGRGGRDGEPAQGEITVSPAQLMRQRGLLDAYA